MFALTTLMVFSATAQNGSSDALAKNSWLIEINTGSFATGSTAFSLTSVDGFTFYSIGAEAGCFVGDNFAIKAGLGYAGADEVDGSFNYKLGAKYYIGGTLPVGIDFTGSSAGGESATWVGLQGGYAWFVASNVSIEPTIRYNASMDSEKAESSFQGLIGFAFHF